MGKKDSRAAAKAKGKATPVAKKPEPEEVEAGETENEQPTEEFNVELKDEQVRDSNFYSDVIKIEKYFAF